MSYRRDRDRDYSDDDSTPRDKLTRFNGVRGVGVGSPSSVVGGGVNVTLNLEQMIAMVFEMRGTIAHEIEARRATEMALHEARTQINELKHEARQQIETLKESAQRDNNKWQNLLGRVKELEVAGKLDNRLVEMNQRQEKYTRSNDQTKLMTVFQQIQQRLDSQERDYRDGLSKVARDHLRDQQRLEHDLRSNTEQYMLKLDGHKQNESEYVKRLQTKLTDLEKEFAIFMNTQVLMQQNMNNKEKDGDWLKIYLTEQFNAQKHATENQFKDVEHQFSTLQNQIRLEMDKLADTQERKYAELSDAIENERVTRDGHVKKLNKGLKQTVTTLSDNLAKAIGVLDSKISAIKSTQNEAITNLHNLVVQSQDKFTQHQTMFQDFVGIQNDQTAKEHVLGQRIDGLEDVLKAEIKSRLKNYQKSKVYLTAIEDRLNQRFDSFKSQLQQSEQEKLKQSELLRAEEEEQARLFNIAMETRSILDAIVGQVEESHYVEQRKNEWKAFGEVMETELKQRDEMIERKIEETKQGANTEFITSKIEEMKSYVHSAFAEYEAHERIAKADEEEQAALMNIAMESRACLDSIVTHIVDVHESDILRLISDNIRVLDERTQTQTDRLSALRQIVETEHDSSAAQLKQTHTEVMELATELAQHVDGHTAQIEALIQHTNDMKMEMTELGSLAHRTQIDVGTTRSQLGELADQIDLHGRDLKQVKLATNDATDRLDTHQLTLKNLQHHLTDHRAELDLKSSNSSAKVDELAAVVSRLDHTDKRVETIRVDVKELMNLTDAFITNEKHQRELKEVHAHINEVEEYQKRDSKLMKEQINAIDETQVKQYKLTTMKIEQFEDNLKTLNNNSTRDDGKRTVDAAHIEKEVKLLESQFDQLNRKLKDTTNLHEDSLNHVTQDVKKLALRVDGLDQNLSTSSSAAAANGDSMSIETKKGLNDLSFRVDALENDMKVKTVNSFTGQIQELTQKFDQRSREVDAKFSNHEQRCDKMESDIKRLNDAADDTNDKIQRRLRELQQSIDVQALREIELTNTLKTASSKHQLAIDESIQASESRINGQLKSLQSQLETHESDVKSRFRTIDEKLHDMEWSLEYAKEIEMKKDAKNIMLGAGAGVGANTQSIQQSPTQPQSQPQSPQTTQ